MLRFFGLELVSRHSETVKAIMPTQSLAKQLGNILWRNGIGAFAGPAWLDSYALITILAPLFVGVNSVARNQYESMRATEIRTSMRESVACNFSPIVDGI